MVILGQRWAEDYMKKNPDAQIQVTGGGSGTGISALINGTTDICQSSRAMKPAEKEKVRDRYNTTGVEIPVANDGLAVYVHASNPLTEITMEQLKEIFTGKVTNWKELGGPTTKIIVYSRENSSGTYVFFKDAVLEGRDFTPRAQTMPGTAAVVNAVSKEVRHRLRRRRLRQGHQDPQGQEGRRFARRASRPADGEDGSYPLSRPLFFYTAQQAERVTSRPSSTWCCPPRVRPSSRKVGYFPHQVAGCPGAVARGQARQKGDPVAEIPVLWPNPIR